MAAGVLTGNPVASLKVLNGEDGRQQRMIFTTRRPFGEALPKVGDTLGYSAAMAAKAPRTSDLFQGTVAKVPLAAVWAPTIRGSEIVALTTVTIEPPELTALLRDEHLPDGWIATIIDQPWHYRCSVCRARKVDRNRGIGRNASSRRAGDARHLLRR